MNGANRTKEVSHANQATHRHVYLENLDRKPGQVPTLIGLPVVYGVDRSPEMLRMAIRKNQGNSVCFLLQDFTDLLLPQRVDVIAGTSIR